MSKLYIFGGGSGAFAYTVDPSGANLPETYAPWSFVRPIDTADRSFRSGTDKAALAEVEAAGFSIRIFTVTFEPPLPQPGNDSDW